MKTILILISLFSVLSLAAEPTKKEKRHEHREHGAHIHGGGTLAIAFDDMKGKIEFKGAAEGILGFEHQPRSDQDKKTVADAIAHFEKDISKMIQFDPSLNCQLTKDMIGQVPEEGEEGSGEHSDWAANFSVACGKSPVGTKLTVDFTSFKRIKDLDITVLAASVQKSAEYKGKKPVVIELK
jgi:hypothetical protein